MDVNRAQLAICNAFALAGYFAAHSFWCIADGDILIPILAFRQRDGDYTFQRVQLETLEASVVAGQKMLNDQVIVYDSGALLYDGYMTISHQKIDAIVVEIGIYGVDSGAYSVMIPYQPKRKGQRFAIHRPKFVLDDSGNVSLEAASQAFFAGIAHHKKGSKVWRKALDESV